MVGIITGKGPGIENSSLALLGSSGQLGTAPVGRADESVFVNAATGNLVITDTDEMLVGRGADAIIARTYNSLGGWEGDSAADGWRTGLYRKLANLPGTYGTGTITRVDWDGSEAVYTWDGTRNAYFTTDGAGAYDMISQVAGVWTWTDGDTQVHESYDAAGLIATRYDDDNNVVTYTFTSGVLTKVQTSNGEYSDFLYTSGLLTSIETHSSYPTATITRTRYTYSGGRLASVKTDLTPADGSIADAVTYTVSYTYQNGRIFQITQSDSTWIEVTYDASGRVTQLKQAESGTGTIVYRSTFFNYDTPGTTKVTDPAGQVTALSYDANGNLTRIEAPASGAGQPVQVTTFTYDAATGDVTSVTRGGNTTSFTYDRGNRVLDRDAAGNIVERVYSAANQLLAETRYLDPDTDGAGPDSHGTPLVTRYVYDSENHLRYVVTPELSVTEYRYDGFGQQVSRIAYVSKPGSTLLTGAATDAGNATNLGLLDTWVSITADRSAAQRTDTWYDFRGNVSRTASYATLDGFGRGSEAPLVIGAGTNTNVQQQDDGLYRIAKTSGGTGWNADAHSTVRADGDFVLQLRPGQNNLAIVGGLSASPALNANEGNLAYGIYFKSSGNAIVTMGGTETGTATSYAANTSFWITRVGSTITYWKGATLATAVQFGPTSTFTGSLYFDSSIDSAAATMDVGFTPLNITNGAGTAVTLGADGLHHVVKTDGTWDWTADARGSEAAAGDFVLRVRPSQTNKAFYAGVSANPALSSAGTNIDYGFRFNNDGEVRRGDAGGTGTLGSATVTYVAGDSFWLVRTGSTLNYYKGATLDEAMRAGPLAPAATATGTLYFDSSILVQDGAFDVRFTPRTTIANGASTAVTATSDGMYHVVKTGTGSSWGADARGSEAATGDFVLRLRPSQSNLIFVAGVSRNPGASASNDTVDYAIRFNNGTATKGNGGADQAFSSPVTYAAGDNFWIVRTGTTLTYYKGATLAAATAIYSASNVTGTLYFDSSLYSPNAAFDARLDVSPSAIAEVTTTSYVYDPAGRLLSRAVTGKGVETFVYDGMGRIISSKDFNGATTGVTFSSVSNTTLTTVTLANSLVRTSTYNRAGQLISSTDTGTGISATTTYAYDTLGRLRMATDPTGRRSHHFYDALGRKIGEVDADGSAVEYRYDSSDNLTSTTRYVTNVDPALLVDGSGNPKNFTFDAVRPAANANDRWTWRVYDRANRLVETIETVNDAGDAVLGVQGAVTTYEYDGASRLIGTRRYDDLLDKTRIATLKTAAQERWGNTENGTAWYHGGSTVVAETNLTDNGTTIVGGKIEGASAYRVTVNTNGNAGVIRPHNNGFDVNAGDTMTMTFWVMAGSVSTQYFILRGSTSVYGGAGETTATILSGPGTLSSGTTGIRYVSNLSTTEPTLISITRTFTQSENVTASIYAGTSGSAAQAGDSIVVANPTLIVVPASALSLPTEVGADDDRVTRNFYDSDGRLVAMLDAEGYLTEIEYDGAGRKVHTIGYAKKTNVGSPATATLADLRTSITTASGYDAARNVNNYWIYDDRGMLRATIDGESALTRYDYDAAGYVARQTSGELLPVSSTPTMATLPLAVDANASIASWTRNLYGDVLTETRSLTGTVTTTTSYSYDVMRRLVSTTTQPGGADQRIYLSIYDQLGRLTGEIGGEGNAAIAAGATQAQALIDYGWTYNYDAAGRLTSKIGPDASDRKTFYYYDADGALAYQVEAYDHLTVGEVTKYSYNAFGERTLVTAYAKRISLNGLTGGSDLTQVTNVLEADATLDTTTSVTFNTDGTVDTTTDPLTIASSFTYNAFGEVEKSTVALDNDGTNGAARSIVTTRTYDRRGQLTRESVALPTATGGDLDTQYVYDAFGRATSVINAKGEETKSTYDEDGRLISVEDALHHITRYTYDARDNLVAVIDALGHVTRYVYDRGGRRIATIDAEGGVVGMTYDADGRMIATRAYAGLYPGTLPDPFSTTEPPLTDATVALPTPDDSADRITRYAYGKDGQLRFTVEAIDAENRVTEQKYDKAGNPVRAIVYGGTIAAPAGGYTVDAINTAVTGRLTHVDTRITRSVYDAGRLTYTIDAENRITAFTYDAKGAVTKQVRLATLYPFTGDPTDLSMDNWVTASTSPDDRTTRAIYDRKGQLSFSVDALGYVTRFEYDKAGNLKKRSVFAGQYLTIDDSSTVASVTTLTNGGAATAAVTSFKYDVAGRLIETTNPEGGVTALVLDDLGRIVTSTIAGSTTRYEYDAAGRTTKETRGYGTADASITGFTYTDANQLETRTEGQTGDVSTTRWRYDDAGRVEYEDREVDEAAGYDVTIAYAYNAFGDQVKVTDARGNASFFYYDQLGRVKRAIDAERYVTDTSYTRGDQVYQVKRYAKAIVTGVTVSVTDGPAPASDANDATTTFTYNKRDELKEVKDAENYSDKYLLNNFGDRIQVTNKLNGVTINTFDKLGRLETETLPVLSGTSAIVNKYEYDSRGNRTKVTEAFGLTEQRITNYTYDKNDRLKTTTGNAVSIVDNSLATLTNKIPTQTVFYDARGNAVEIVVGDQTIDTDDARTLAWYDSLNRKTAELSPVGTLTEWTYDDRGNIKTVKVYDYVFAMPDHVDPAVYLPRDTTGLTARITTYDYDRLDRLWKTTTASLVTGEWDAVNSAYVVTTAAIVTTVDYDAAGNVVRQDDGRGNNVWSYYDKLGRKIAQVDRGNYLTTWAYDAEGNALTETRFAGQIGFAVNANTPVTDPANNPAIVSLTEGAGVSGYDRKTTFTYDLMGRRLSETRWKVESGTIDSAGNLVANTTATTNAAIYYEYNGLGQVLEKTEANLDTTVYDYDAIGRLENETGQSFYDFENDLVTPYTDYVYDGLNNLKSTTVYGKDDTVSTDDRKTSYVYGAGGRLATMTDAAGFTRTYAYDIAGRVVRESYTRERNGTPASVTEAVVYRYDLAGRMTLQTNARNNGTSWVFTDAASQYYDAIRMRYNAFGEIDRRGLTAGPGVDIGVGTNPAWQESFDYDLGGRLWSSTSGDGVRRYYLYDEAGNQTLAFAPSSGTTALTFADAAALTAQLTSAGGLKSTYTYAANAVTTITAYDARGQAFKTIEPDRQLSAAPATATATTQTITRSRTYNAFGEVSSETDARANTTIFYYNTMGRLVEKRLPSVNITKENGDVVAVVTNELYTYDVSGRLIAVDDANRFIDTQGHLTTRKLLAGSGHGDSEAVVTKEFHAGGLGVFETLYDVFGDARILRNELYDPADPDSDESTGADELRDYDAMGRLLTLTHRGGLLTDDYRYDGLGQRLRHWNSFLTGTTAETTEYTDYDAQGRVTSMVQLGGDATTYTYLWEQDLVTTGLGSFGGWKKITQNAANAANDDMIERTDYFGRLIDKVDFGGVTYGDDYAFTYDKAGHLTQRTNNKGENLTYSWYNTGLIASLVSGYVGDTYYGQTVTSSYGYDAQGNRTVEKYEASGHNYDWYGGSAWSYTVSHQSTTATYDALNRVTKIEDTSGASGSAPIKVEYWYDAVGNIRRSRADYRKLDEQGAVASGTTTQDYWYRYDAMNRFTLTQGSFSNGAITGGTAITYDKAGRRKTMTHYATDLTRMGWRLTPPGGSPRWYENHQGDSGTWELLAYTYSGDRRETYNYTADGHLESVYVNQTTATFNGWSPPTYGAMNSSAGTERASYTTDAMGRVTHVSEVNNLTDSYVRSTTYNNKSQVTSETVTTTHGTTADRPSETYEAATTYYYNAVSAGSGLWDGVTTGGVYMGGAVTATTTINKKNGSDADPAAKDTSMKYRFAWRDGLVQKKSTYDKDTSPSGTEADWVTDFYHDASGNIVSARIADGRPRSVSFITDGNGLILQRDETDNYTATGDPRELHYYFNGLRIGDISNNGTSDIDYAQSIAEHTRAPGGTGAFRGGVDWTPSNQYKLQYADFDQSYDPINGLNYATTASRYTTQEGDTLSSIALQVWGDASLWYLIASANGLSGTEQIASGMSLIIPNNSVNAHHNTETFKVYDPNRAMGDNSPTANARPPKNRGCGFFGQVIAAVIAKVVSMLVASIPVVGPILAPFAENITRQGVLILTGDQEKFNWKSVGMVGVDMLVPNPGGLIGGALHNAGVQVVGRALGLQEGKFDWASVAVAGVSSMVTAAFGISPLGNPAGAAVPFGQNFLANMGATLAGAATRSIVTGTSFGDNIIAVLPDLAALTVGEAYSELTSPSRAGRPPMDELDAKAALHQSKAAEQQGSLLDGYVDPLVKMGEESGLYEEIVITGSIYSDDNIYVPEKPIIFGDWNNNGSFYNVGNGNAPDGNPNIPGRPPLPTRKEGYELKKPNPKMKATEFDDKFLSKLENQFIPGAYLLGMDDAAEFLTHYISRDGPMDVDVKEMYREISSFRKDWLTSFDSNILVPARELISDRYDGKAMEFTITGKWESGGASKDVSWNWYYAMNGFDYAQTAYVSVAPAEGGLVTVRIDSKTYVSDVYNWDEASGKSVTIIGFGTIRDKDMARLAYLDRAREFYVRGEVLNKPLIFKFDPVKNAVVKGNSGKP